MDESFDINKIVYASKNSKITLKTKQKLDELAAQVAFWNSEIYQMSSNKENRFINFSKPAVPNVKKNFMFQNNQFLQTNSVKFPLTESRTCNRKSMLDCKGSVKEKKAYFESLTQTTPQDKNPLFKFPQSIKNIEFPEISELSSTKVNQSVIEELNEDIININEEIILPPPPPYVPDESENDDEEIAICDKIKSESLKNETTVISELETSWINEDTQPNNISSDLTRVSSLTSSLSIGSMFDEFVSEYGKMVKEQDVESLPEKCTKIEPIKPRRSLSFNDKINIIEIGCDSDSSENIVNKPIRNLELNEPINNTRISYPSTDDDSRDNSELSDEPTICFEMEEIKQKSCHLIKDLEAFSSTCIYKPGDLRHVEKCINIVKNNLLYASMVEQIHHQQNSNIGIIADIDIHNVRFSIKDDYVFFNYKALIARGYQDKINRLSSLYHVVLVGRSVGGSVITESDIYSIVKRRDADRTGLDYYESKWLEFFEDIDFLRLSAGFKLNFELYCMNVAQKKLDQLLGTPKKRTPMKKLFCDSPIQINDSPVLLSNVGTFNLTSTDFILNNDFIDKSLNLPNSNPFDGNVKLNGSMSFSVASSCEGRLNVYIEVGKVGSWAFRDCQVSHTGIIGGKKSKIDGIIEEIDIKIPFFAMNGSANLCDFQVCAKSNSFSVLLIKQEIKEKMPVNRRISTDGKRKYRFLAAADSTEDALRWCKCINECSDSFRNWSKNIDLL